MGNAESSVGAPAHPRQQRHHRAASREFGVNGRTNADPDYIPFAERTNTNAPASAAARTASARPTTTTTAASSLGSSALERQQLVPPELLDVVIADGSSVECRKCGDVISAKRWRAHEELWCPYAAAAASSSTEVSDSEYSLGVRESDESNAELSTLSAADSTAVIHTDNQESQHEASVSSACALPDHLRVLAQLSVAAEVESRGNTSFAGMATELFAGTLAPSARASCGGGGGPAPASSPAFGAARLSAGAFARVRQHQNMRRVLRVLVIGDSLIEGYYDAGASFHPPTIAMEKRLARRFGPLGIDICVTNAGRCGDTAAGICERLLQEVIPDAFQRVLRQQAAQDLADKSTGAAPSQKPRRIPLFDAAVVLGGTNDLGVPETSAEDVLSSLTAAVNTLREYDACPIVAAVGIPQHGIEERIHAAGSDNVREKRAAINSGLRSHCISHEITFIDLDATVGAHGGGTHAHSGDYEIWCDDLHFTPFGYDLFGETISSAIEPLLVRSLF